jgi:cell division ATPase FtsA
LKQTILNSIKSIALKLNLKKKFALFNLYSENLKLNEKYKNLNETILLSLPATFLKSRIVSSFLKREKADKKISKIEAEDIYEQVLANVKGKVLQEFAQNFGILPQDIKIISLKFVEIKIDGYLVPSLQDYRGEFLGFKVLINFLPKNYLTNIREIIEDLIIETGSAFNLNYKQGNKKLSENLARFISKKVKVIYPYQSLRVLRDIENDTIFIDIGGEITQFFLVKRGNLSKIGEFKIGGRAFSQKLCDSFGIEEERARELKEKYSKKLLSPESVERIKEILETTKNDWIRNFKAEIKKINGGEIFPVDIFIFGGASQLPEIQESLIKIGNEEKEIDFILSKGLPETQNRVKILKQPQNAPCLLISNSIN